MHQNIDHHYPDHELLSAADGELSQAHQDRLNAHLTTCADCSARLGHLMRVLGDTSALYRADFAAPSADDGRARLQHALGELNRTWAHSWSTRLRRTLATSPTYAVLGIATPLVLTVWLSGAPPSPAQPRVDADATSLPMAALTSLPMAALTPGAVSTLTASELCSGARPSRRVSIATRDRVLASYRMQQARADAYELDALITPELGGTTDAENLWPQMYGSPVWNARVKDELERLLPALVCSGDVDLARAQQEIATDWIAAYRRYFKTDVPLQTHVGPPLDEPGELELEPAPNAPVLVAFSRSTDSR